MIYMRLVTPKEHRRALGIRSNRELRDILEAKVESTGDQWRAENQPEPIADNQDSDSQENEPATDTVLDEAPSTDAWEEWPTYDFD